MQRTDRSNCHGRQTRKRLPPFMPNHQVFHGDSLPFLRGLPTASVDLVVTSPPYEDARTYGIGFKRAGTAWVKWALPIYMECVRVSRGLTVWVVQGRTVDRRWSATPALLMAELHRAGVCLRNPPIFGRYGIPGSGGDDWLRSDYEWCISATHKRGKLPWSDNTACGHVPKWGPGGELSYRLTDGTRRNQRANGDRKAPYMRAAKGPVPKLANPGNVLWGVVGGNQMGHKLAHLNEAPFPLWLAEFFIKSFCPPSGTVLDCFGGSGTTTHAAEINGRNSIYIDKRKSQVNIALRRIFDVTGEERDGSIGLQRAAGATA